MAQIKIGVIGTGGMAQGHIKRLMEHEDAAVAALCDIKPQALERTIANHPGLEDVPRFADFGEMLRNTDLDAVQIITPHTVHYDQIIESLGAGLHVLTEKPMVCKVSHAHHVVKAVQESGKVLVLSYQRHYQPEFLYIRNAIKSGEYGPVQFVQGLQCQGWYRGCRGSWRQEMEWGGGGQLNDSGSHLLAVLLFVTGLSVNQVGAFIDNFDVPVDINSALSIQFDGGAQGNISVVGNAPSWHEDITIWCDRGVFYMRQGTLEVCRPDGSRFKPTAAELPKGDCPDDNFVDAILGRAEVGSPAIWGLRVIELTEAAWKSAASGKIEQVEHVKA
ncbi:MAG: Gfo/Idh/MocA family oxidoreductase [Armatimonadetes bacterium]|nr:Gfo/Idh/MocA family oxidoreductase [Armatimonadota bacterium]MDE2206351.1 Gfo/Idh/MocA family oxidoreductase [Armatimonadota bacterium]